MSQKNVYLFAGVITSLVFLGYLSEPGPYEIFGRSISIWIVRALWLIIAVGNFSSYYRIRKVEQGANKASRITHRSVWKGSYI